MEQAQDYCDTPFPTTKDEADKIEEIFVKEFEKLSLQEHEKILMDVHGLGYLDDEPESLAEKLQELEKELTCVRNKYALERARYLNRSYVDDPKFRIMFLRSQKYNIPLTTQLLVSHFEHKQRLFGDGEILGRDIRIADLDKDSLEVLESGSVQILPTRDAAGRAIEVSSMEWDRKIPSASVCRAIWYYYMLMFRDEEIQRKGFVSILYNYSTVPVGTETLEQIRASVWWLPAKICGIHYCTKSDTIMPFTAGIRLMMEDEERLRVKTHLGTPQEVQFQLQTYGIPTDHTPLQPDGSWSTTEFREWLEDQRKRELKEVESDDIIVPRRYDVLFGRSKHCREHVGNTHLVFLCETRLEEYEAADKPAKTRIARGLLDTVKESQGRFLKWDKKVWVEVNDVVAREKIGHFFRHMRSKASSKPSTTRMTGKRTTSNSSPTTVSI